MDPLLALFLFAAFMVATPGPANLLLMTGGSRFGTVRCIPFIFGLITGKAALNTLVALGFGTVVGDSPQLQLALKFVSGGYMIWLAIQSWNSVTQSDPTFRFTFAKGCIVHPLNPKAWVMILLAWSDFAPALGSFWYQAAACFGCFALVQVIFHVIWVGTGEMIGKAVGNTAFLTRTLAVLTILVVLLVLAF